MQDTNTSDKIIEVIEITEEPEIKEVMSLHQKRFYASTECGDAREALALIVENPAYDTDSDYFSGNELGFVDRHLHYLSTHPQVKLAGYISNLKLMTKVGRKQS